MIYSARMRWVFLIAAVASAQTFEISPATVRQGETIRLHGTGTATSARMDGRTIRLFGQAEGGWLGLMPVVLDATPGEHKIEFLGADGRVADTGAVKILEGGYPVQNVVIGKAQEELKAAPGEMDMVRALRDTVSDVRYWKEPLIAPVPGCMVSPFGVKRLHNGKPTGAYHRGVDLRSPAGRPIRASAAGVVRIVRMFNVHGGTVGIDHGQGLTSMYLHMSRFATQEGAVVNQGDVIGYVGSTGVSNGPHVHWTLQVNGIAVSPRQWADLKICGRGGRRSTEGKK